METSVDTTTATNSQLLSGDVHLEARNVNVWFSGKHVLDNVNLQFPKNSVTALIGPSGCGKSTFIRTLDRMHELIPGAQLSGEVLFNGKDIYGPAVDPISVRLNIGMVFQKPNPFPTMTIRENVLSGLKLSGRKVSDEDSLVESCITRASLWPEVKDRLNSSAGSLSGGQQQRLAIARALLKNAPVLLLDEAPSALDSESERMVQAALERLSEGRTVVAIAHRLSTILNSDCIVVMDHGRIAATGRHEELLAKSDLYRSLYELQFHHSEGPVPSVTV